ncbi:CheR family methyltransferase [Marinobacteraceae bacterium S3BR75-40.1]
MSKRTHKGGRKDAAKKPVHHKSASTNDQQEMLVVGIGASAGGLDPIGTLIEHIPADTGFAFIVVQHLKQDQKTMLTSLLQSHTVMAVEEIRDGTVPQANHVYVIPPGQVLEFEDAELRLSRFPEGVTHQSTIDRFFISLAQTHQQNAVGILLSGSGSDGTEGLRRIKGEGGITFAQDDATAQFATMPDNAVKAGCVDLVLSPAQIAQHLVQLIRNPLIQEQEEGLAGERAINDILLLLREYERHDFTHYKHSTLRRRIKRRMLLQRIEKKSDYLAMLKASEKERQLLTYDFLINVTGFFRNPETFDAIKNKVLPELMKHKAASEGLRIWVPACSTGEEVYSLAIVVAEYMDEHEQSRPVQIFATDIDGDAITKARLGFYTQQQVADITPGRLKRFFTRNGEGRYQINKRIRSCCVFSEQDATQDPPFARLDLISCRNLLIYLDRVLQRRLFTLFHFALRPWGRLVLGSSESISNGEDCFMVADKKHRIYQKKSGKRVLPRPTRSMPVTHMPPIERPAITMNKDSGIQQKVEHIILEKYGPPGVVIDQDMSIVSFLGHTGPFIDPAPGSVSFKLLKMAQRDLVLDLRTVLKEAFRTGNPAEVSGVRFNLKKQEQTTRIVVEPLTSDSGQDAETYYLVLFLDAHLEAPPLPSVIPEGGTKADKDTRIQELENDLYRTRHELKAVINDHVATNEELQNANEQIQSANEELQSTNEELESAQEELQSTNEELATLNDELEARNSALAQANADLRNLLSSVQLPVLMLNRNLEIRQFTPLAKPLLNVIDTDIGRPFTDLSPNLMLPELQETIERVMNEEAPQTMEVADGTGSLFSISVRPYRDLEDNVVGVVLVFFDITDIKKL